MKRFRLGLAVPLQNPFFSKGQTILPLCWICICLICSKHFDLLPRMWIISGTFFLRTSAEKFFSVYLEPNSQRFFGVFVFGSFFFWCRITHISSIYITNIKMFDSQLFYDTQRSQIKLRPELMIPSIYGIINDYNSSIL